MLNNNEGWRKNFNKNNFVQKQKINILVIRYSSVDHICEIISSLKIMYPMSEIRLLLQEDIQNAFLENKDIFRKRIFNRGDLKPGIKLFRIIMELRKQKFEHVIIPYNNLLEEGYRYIEGIAFLITGGTVLTFHRNQKAKHLLFIYYISNLFVSIFFGEDRVVPLRMKFIERINCISPYKLRFSNYYRYLKEQVWSIKIKNAFEIFKSLIL